MLGGGFGGSIVRSLLVCHVPTKTFHSLDSAAPMNEECARNVAHKMAQLLRWREGEGEVEVHPVSCPQQKNGADCGVFVLLYAEVLLQDVATWGEEVPFPREIGSLLHTEEELRDRLRELLLQEHKRFCEETVGKVPQTPAKEDESGEGTSRGE